MKSSNKERLKPRFSWIGMVAAIFVAVAMWWFVSQRGRIEGEVEVNLTYNDVPPNLIVTNGLVNTIRVRLQGPEALMSSILHERLTRAISLASIRKGDTFVPIPTEHLSPELRAFEIISVIPDYINVVADTVKERVVPIRVVFDPPMPTRDLDVNYTVNASTVTLRGPESVVMGEACDAVVVRVSPDPLAPGSGDQIVQLYTPSFVTATPASVRIHYTITLIKETISRRCNVHIAQDATRHYSVEPKDVELKVEVPQSRTKSKNYLDGIKASAVPSAMEPGESKMVKVDIELPEGAKLVSVSPREVKVTRLKK